MDGFGTIDDIRAFEAMPLAERDLANSTYEAICRVAEKYPNNAALHFFLEGTAYKKSVRFSFRELVERLNQTANMLHDLGIGPEDTVSYVLPNLPQTYFTLYGGEAVGIANPINPLLEPHVIAEILNAAQTKVLVTIGPFPRTDVWEKVASIANDVPTLETILQIDIGGYLSGIKKLVVNLMRFGKGKEPVRAKVLNFDNVVANYPTDRLTFERTIKPDDTAAYFHTGGTTGTPKLATHTHFNQVFDGWAAGLAAGADDKTLNYLGLPLFHNYGAIAIALGSWSFGGGVVMGSPQGFRGEGVVKNLWEILSHYQCTLFSGVPTLFKTLLNNPIGDNDLSNLRLATCGAAPLPVEIANQFTAKTGVSILEGYGLTEGTAVASVNPLSGDQRIGSIGYRLPYTEMRAAIVDGSHFERFCEPNEAGIVIMRGPNVIPGYREDFHNAGAFVDSGDGDGLWLNTGDMGREDEDGYFWLTGRQKELIIRGGHNIDPQQIEEPMYKHPSVAGVAAVGRPDARVGEMPVVYIELKPDTTATTAELLAFAQKNIGERAAVPKDVHILDALPLTNVGKILKLPLIYAQVEDVFSIELKQIDGIASFDVTAESDKRLGTVANVKVTCQPGVDSAALEKTVQQALGQYSVHCNLDCE